MKRTDYFKPRLDSLWLRNAVVKAVNADGTCTLTIDEGDIEEVAVHGAVSAGEAVRVLESPHSRLVLGAGAGGTGGGPGTPGQKGDPGDPGKSAFQLAVEGGFKGTATEWLVSLMGPKGDPGAKGEKGDPGTAVTIGGVVPTVAELPTTAPLNEVHFVTSTGDLYVFDGTTWHDLGHVQGPPGKSAYEVAVAGGFVGTEDEWLASLRGTDGTDGNDLTNIDIDDLVKALTPALPDLISTKPGNSLVIDDGKLMLVHDLILPGSQAIRGSGDFPVPVKAAPTVPVEGIEVTLTNPSDTYDMKVIVQSVFWENRTAAGILYIEHVASGQYRAITSPSSRREGVGYEDEPLASHWTIPPGGTATFALHGRCTTAATVIRYPSLVAIPVGYEAAGASQVAAYAFGTKSAATTTVLSGVPATAAKGTNVTITATVAPATAAGTVQFQYQSGTSTAWVNAGAPVAVAAGKAVKAAGAASVTATYRAVFLPADTSAFKTSTSNSMKMTVPVTSIPKTLSSSGTGISMESYDGDGGKRTSNPTYAYWGLAPGDVYHGDQRSMVVLPAATRTTLAGINPAKITSAKLTFSVLHTFSNSGGDVGISLITNGSPPGSLGSKPAIDFTGSGPKSGTWTVTIPASKYAELVKSTGFVFQRNGSAAADYGYLLGSSVRLTVAYKT